MSQETQPDGNQSPAVVTARLNALTATFPDHYISAERWGDNRIRYIARSRHDNARPRLLITQDLAELYAVLGAGVTRPSG
jgi:hypothetical protein